MPTGRPCTVCQHQDRETIDRALIAGEGFRPIAARFGLTKQALARHAENHVPTQAMQAAAQAVAAAEGISGSGLLTDATTLRDRALTLLDKAEEAADLRTALMGVREAARCLELMAKLAGQIDPATTVNILVAPAFINVQTVIMAALASYPEARGAVVRALGAVE